jgi:hypothetical protein
MKTAIAAIAVFSILGIIVVGSYVSHANYGNKAEVGVEKEYQNLQNILSQYTLKVSEAAQVPSMYKDDMKEVMTSVMSSRMGASGSQAMFQWFKEHQINLDSKMYSKIQALIESGRNQFQNAQTRFLDIKATYTANLGYVWSGMWLGFAGYPNLNVGYPRGTSDDYMIVKSEAAIQTFETGVDSGIKFR